MKKLFIITILSLFFGESIYSQGVTDEKEITGEKEIRV